MRGFNKTIVASVFGLTGAAWAQCSSCPGGQSGPVAVERALLSGGGNQTLMCRPIASGSNVADFTIDLGAWSGWDSGGTPRDWVLRIYECATSSSAPSVNVGKITITGDPSGIASLAVIVASPDQSWTEDMGTPLAQGCIDFGGLAITDADVLAKTRASIAITGDVTQVGGSTAAPDLHANSFVRIQAHGRDGGSSTWIGGHITGKVTAEAAATPYSGSDAIGELRAWSSIEDSVEAKGYNIAAVRVVGDSASTPAIEGISGDILANGASATIGLVYSSGPISNGETDPENFVKITAGNGIGQIRSVEADGTTLVAVSVEANVTANATMLADPENYPYNQPITDGPLTLLDVGGDLRGEVKAANLIGSASGRGGIFVRGICYAPINIEFIVDHSNIIAKTFVEPIRVGRTMRGAIVATGGAETPSEPPPGYADGNIPSITIGDLDDTEVPAEVLTANYFPNARGLVGIFSHRAVILQGEEWFTASSIAGAALDGCVRAQNSIGVANIASLTTQLFAVPGSYACTKYPPVVEAPVIGSLDIEELATGTVWSGQYVENEPDSVYAAIDTIRIGCARRYSAVRATGWTSFVVEHHAFGDIHVPEVSEGSLIQIGGILGDDENAIYEGDLEDELCHSHVHAAEGCESCVADFNNYYAFNPDEGGFRNPTNPYHILCTTPENSDNRGQIWVHEDEGLHGQIVINAANHTSISQAALWTGAV
ncbi:MAG: hypothetical protein HBSAPP03_10010 [Phycisphaerae bacterium]|nr:MAG: hypothetical protein HBSAPP03_10010 [Phycisphaerae bacterium]